ncbi:MAG TPA: flagellar motor protein MotB [Bryobacteraceae bacterium]|nr:flagellar motor protein MotB [Bryobacteraceae bacterium]
MNRHKHPAHENHERWLVSYADFITLLFAFFVVMFATAQADKTKAKAVSQSVRDAMEHGELSAAIAGILHHSGQAIDPTKVEKTAEGQPATQAKPSDSKVKVKDPQGAGSAAANAGDAKPADLVKAAETLQQELIQELNAGKVTVTLDQRGLVISLREAAFFASGDDRINTSSYPMLNKIAAVVQSLPNAVRLEGHTDSIPIHNSRFHNNWELSAGRSIAMLELLSERYHIPRTRMSVAGYAENAPVDSNQTEQGRAHNRRVDLVLLSENAMKGEPHPARGQP